MGLSFHYSGHIGNEATLQLLIEEVADICKTLEWETDIFDGVGDDDHLVGISFAPEGSEAVWLTFLPGGRLCSPISLMCRDIYDGIKFDKEMMFTASTKTQYAGPEAHIAIIKLLKYISAKYLVHFTVSDEGEYWETGDEKILYAQFDKYNFALNAFSEAIGGMQTVAGETPLSLVERIEKILNEKLKVALNRYTQMSNQFAEDSIRR